MARSSISPIHPGLQPPAWNRLCASRRPLFGRSAAMGRERATARSAFHVLQHLRHSSSYAEERPLCGAKSEFLGRGNGFQRLLVSGSRASGPAFLSWVARGRYDSGSLWADRSGHGFSPPSRRRRRSRLLLGRYLPCSATIWMGIAKLTDAETCEGRSPVARSGMPLTERVGSQLRA